MPDLHHLGLVDLVVGVAVVAAALGPLRRGGLVASAAAAIATLLACWLLGAVAVAWGPALLRQPVESSAFAGALPLPVDAVTQGGQLITALLQDGSSSAARP